MNREDVNVPLVHALFDDRPSIAGTIGVDENWAAMVSNKIERLMYDTFVYPFETGVPKPKNNAELMQIASSWCRNIQELAYVMYKLGYAVRMNDEMEEAKKRREQGPQFFIPPPGFTP